MIVYRENNLYVVAQGTVGNKYRLRFVCDGQESWDETSEYNGTVTVANRKPLTLKEWQAEMVAEVLGDTKTGKRLVNPLKRLVAGTIVSAEVNKRTGVVDIEKSKEAN